MQITIPQRVIPTKTSGRLYYNSAQRAWSCIKLKKEFIKNHFPKMLTNKGGYTLVFHRTKEEVLATCEKIKEKSGEYPGLLIFYHDKKKETRVGAYTINTTGK